MIIIMKYNSMNEYNTTNKELKINKKLPLHCDWYLKTVEGQYSPPDQGYHRDSLDLDVMDFLAGPNHPAKRSVATTA